MQADATDMNETSINEVLVRFPAYFNNRWTEAAQDALLGELFACLVGGKANLQLLFPTGIPSSHPNLSEKQGKSLNAGTEYGPWSRGKRCGHIFRKGETIYRCKTCGLDDTCVMCERCFHSSSHRDHDFYLSQNTGGGGVCDCGDDEAWKVPFICSIHTGDSSDKDIQSHQPLPPGLEASIEYTVSRVLDYVCDVISCSPENLRLPKDAITTARDEQASLLDSKIYGFQDHGCSEYAVTLWDDERHSFREVIDQVSRACGASLSFGQAVAEAVDHTGRKVLEHSTDISRLLSISRVIEQIKLAVTIRSSRDVFREEMCATIVSWLTDIAGCTILGNGQLFRETICRQFCLPWKIGSSASNAGLGWQPYDEENQSENSEDQILSDDRSRVSNNEVATTETRSARRSVGSRTPAYWYDSQRTVFSNPAEDPQQRLRIDWLILFDLRLWKQARCGLRDLYIGTMVTIPSWKRLLGIRFASVYSQLAEAFLLADREPDYSITLFSVQVFTTPSIAGELIQTYNFFGTVCAILYTFFAHRKIGDPSTIDLQASVSADSPSLKNSRYYRIFSDLKYFINTEAAKSSIPHNERFLLQFLDLIHLFQGMNPNIRAKDQHVEYESELWVNAFNLTLQTAKLCVLFAEAYSRGPHESTILAIAEIAKPLAHWSWGYEKDRFPAGENKGLVQFKDVLIHNRTFRIVDFDVVSQPISFHHPMHWLLGGLIQAFCDTSQQPTTLSLSMLFPSMEEHLRRDAILALTDYPVRVIVLLSQIKAGLWVRNGFSIRGQQHHYKDVALRDTTFDRDMFLVQVALVTIDPQIILVQMLDRFRLVSWFMHKVEHHHLYDDAQLNYMIEDFLHILILLLSERSAALGLSGGWSGIETMRREIIHILAFGPMTYSELIKRVPDGMQEDLPFDSVLQSLADFHAPDGLTDNGRYTLKKKLHYEVDPYFFHYSRNQREEIADILKKQLAHLERKSEEEVAFEPFLRPITCGPFTQLGSFSRSRLFIDILAATIKYAKKFRKSESKAETMLEETLHLCWLSLIDENFAVKVSNEVLTFAGALCQGGKTSPIADILEMYESGHYRGSHANMKRILQIIKAQAPEKYAVVKKQTPTNMELPDQRDSETLQRRLAAKERQANIMAQFQKQQQTFLEQFEGAVDYDDEEQNMDLTPSLQVEETDDMWSFPSDVCIFCQERSDDGRLYGILATIHDSKVFRNTPFAQTSAVLDILNCPASFDVSAEHMRPSQMSKIGEGFPAKSTYNGALATSCGHCFHQTCFESYCANTQQRHVQQISRNHPENIDKKEFVCPLCKSLGNVFLPVVWPNKAQTQPSKLFQSQQSFADFLQFSCGPAISRLEKAIDSTQALKRKVTKTREMFHEYNQTGLAKPVLESFESLGSAHFARRMHIIQRRSVIGLEDMLDPEFVRRSSFGALNGSEAVHKMYRRLLSVLQVLGYSPTLTDTPDELTDIASLWRLMSSTIASTELLFRGQASPGPTLLSQVPEQLITLLRILAETILTYSSMSVCQRSEQLSAVIEFSTLNEVAIKQLFIGHPSLSEAGEIPAKGCEPLLSTSIFDTFVQASFCTILAVKFEPYHLLRLYYLAEIVKTTIAIAENTMESETNFKWVDQTELAEMPVAEDIEFFESFATTVLHERRLDSARLQRVQSLNSTAYRTMVERYALIFLRKSLVLFSSRFFMATPHAAEMEGPELERLCHLLRLPSPSEMFASFTNDRESTSIIKPMIVGWCRHFAVHPASRSEQVLDIPHPSIYELVKLPKALDILFTQRSLRPCKKCGNVPPEPALCLFCGEILCYQAFCCAENDKGECNLHIQTCGGQVGIFLVIKKCAILILHGSQGSFMNAPYLDLHGETDLGLKYVAFGCSI